VDPHFSDFDYKPLPPLAPVTLFLGVSSAFALLSATVVVLAVFGLVLGLICLRQIRRSNGALGGKMLTRAGVALCGFFLVTGSVWHGYVYATEVPEGYRRLNFLQDISLKEFIFEDGMTKLHPDVAALEGQNVFVKGYIYQSKETMSGLPFETLVLVKDNQICCFGANPKPSDMIVVTMAKGKSARYVEGLVSVGGEFHARAPYSPTQQEPVYGLTGDFVEPARTGY
jgi:hypothetical protein